MMFGMGLHPPETSALHQLINTQLSGGPSHGNDGQMTPMTPGQISYFRNMQQDTTPKYIKNMRDELNVALKKNLELSRKLEAKEEEMESDIQNRVITIGEKFS